MKKILSIVLIVFCAFAHEVKALEAFKIDEFYLDNGLQVIVLENNKSPIVKHMVFYKSGAVDEKKMQGGIAHLLEHLMFRGTSKVEGQSFNRIVEKNGIESNAFTAQDVTAYHQFADIGKLELLMYLEADRMRNLSLKDDDFLTEKEIVFQERKQRIDNNPSAKFFEKLNELLWQDHHYGNPITGFDYEISGLKKEYAQNFYDMYYAPNNAVLVLAGDIDRKTAEILAKKYYGGLKPAKISETKFELLLRPYKAKIEMSLPEIRLKRMIKKFVAPSVNVEKEKFYALMILENYLAGDENSPFYQKLVVKDKGFLSASVSYDGIKRSYGTFVIEAVPADIDDKKAEQKINEAFKYAINVLDEKKLEKVKQKMMADFAYIIDNPDDLSLVVGYMVAVGMKVDEISRYFEAINAVKLDDIKKTAFDLWNNAPQVVGVLHPEGVK